MSETEQQPPVEEPQSPPPAPAEPPPPEQPAEPDKERQEAEGRLERRIAQMRARLGDSARERDQMAQRLAAVEAQLRNGGQPPPQIEPQLQALIEQRAEMLAEQKATAAASRSFHAAGQSAFPDWNQRCADLQAMGADPKLAEMLVKMPAGHTVAAALRDDPDALTQIVDLPDESSRGIALGQFAATLKAQPTRGVSRAPRPPAPVQGRVAPQFDPYAQNASTDQLVDYFAKQAMDRRRA